jgi:hypothetical protein
MAEDDMVVNAAELVTRTGRASASLVQAELIVGSSRASRLMDELEHFGIIGPRIPVPLRRFVYRSEFASATAGWAWRVAAREPSFVLRRSRVLLERLTEHLVPKRRWHRCALMSMGIPVLFGRVERSIHQSL